MSEWTVREPTVLEIAEPVRSVEVRVVSGRVDLVPGDSDGAHLEVTEIEPDRFLLFGDPERNDQVGERVDYANISQR